MILNDRGDAAMNAEYFDEDIYAEDRLYDKAVGG